MKNKQTTEERSPLKEKPLRYAGQSIDDQIDDLINDQMASYMWSSFVAFSAALLAWLHWLSDQVPRPLPYTLSAAIIIGLTLRKYVQVRRRVKQLKLGRDGERVVGQLLDELRGEGYHVFHDVPGDGFNLDHVVISTRGVLVVETKTRSKPIRGDVRVRFDGKQVLVNGMAPDRDPITQAEALRAWLRDLLARSTGKQFPVQAMVVFPGWYVETPRMPQGTDVWVTNPKALPAFLAKSPERLKPEDAQLASFHLARFIQASD